MWLWASKTCDSAGNHWYFAKHMQVIAVPRRMDLMCHSLLKILPWLSIVMRIKSNILSWPTRPGNTWPSSLSGFISSFSPLQSLCSRHTGIISHFYHSRLLLAISFVLPDLHKAASFLSSRCWLRVSSPSESLAWLHPSLRSPLPIVVIL